MIKLIAILCSFILSVSVFIFKFVNQPSDWNIPKPLSLLDSTYVVMSSLTSVGFTNNLFPASERAKMVVMVLELMILCGVVVIVQNKISLHLI